LAVKLADKLARRDPILSNLTANWAILNSESSLVGREGVDPKAFAAVLQTGATQDRIDQRLAALADLTRSHI
jgi:hypothetical protein